MTDPLVPIGDGDTELDEEDRAALIPTYIASRRELNEAEQRSIANALLHRRPTRDSLLDDIYLRELHRAMFGEVWEWAGRYRTTETNTGIDPTLIPVAVRALVDDARASVDCETYEPDELAIRFHHRLVATHAFPNGNGRHGRIAADYLVTLLGREPFTWGAGLDVDTAELRRAYLRSAARRRRGDRRSRGLRSHLTSPARSLATLGCGSLPKIAAIIFGEIC